MFKRVRNNRGQTALEYALVIGVIVVGVIFAGQKVFGKKDSVAEKLMNQAVDQAQKTMSNPGQQ
jgi:Flp pilus assembly pilin Flp